jgi:hypothetical protein
VRPEDRQKIPTEDCYCGASPLDVTLRKRTISGGGIQYVFQCDSCGYSRSPAMARIVALELTGGTEPSAWDNDLMEQEERRHRQAVDDRVIQRAAQLEERRRQYHEYLKTPQWAAKRQVVLERCQHLCEGCRSARAILAHHLTYAHVGRELLFELVGLCQSCHDLIHNEGEPI